MKWLALLLVLANVVYFGWRTEQRLQQAQRQAAPPAPLPPNAPSLRLLRELEALPPLKKDALTEPANLSAMSEEAETLPATPAVDAGVTPLALPEEAPAVAVPASPAADIADSASETLSATPPATPAPASPPATEAGAAEGPVIVERTARATAVAADTCMNIGPFAQARDADTVEAWLAPRATELHRVTQVVRTRHFFWVYLAPKTAEEARARVADLTREGVSDFLLIQREGLKNAISLGLFSTQDAVNRRLSEMNQRGYQPIVVPRVEKKQHTWLRANLAVGYTDISTLPVTANTQPIDCARIADPHPSP
ncbi:MAG: hypothetical protein AB7O21_13735 [Gammaproteobacteria bacterium]